MRAHDNHIVGYTVEGRARRIVLHTENVYVPEPHPRLDVVFSDVEIYRFECAALVSILNDITEMPLRKTLEAMADELDVAYRRCGWPDRWESDPVRRVERLRELEARGARFFEIGSDIGFEGWIIASGFDYLG